MTVAELAVAAVKEVVVAVVVKLSCVRRKMSIAVAVDALYASQFVAISIGPCHVSETVTEAKIEVSQPRQIHMDSASLWGCL